MTWLLKFVAMMRVVCTIVVTRLGVFGAFAALVAVVVADDIQGLWERVKGDVNGALADMVREKTQLELDPGDPLSDRSIAQAITDRSGIEVTSVMDGEILARDLAAHAAGLIEEKTTVKLTNLLDAGQIKVDVVSHATGAVKQHTGLDLDGAVTYDAIQKRIADHVKDKLIDLVVDRLHDAAGVFANPESTLDELLGIIYRASEAKKLRARDVALGVAAAAVVAAYSRISVPMKRRVELFRKRAQRREAQRRFRARHGNRIIYVPVKDPKPAEGG